MTYPIHGDPEPGSSGLSSPDPHQRDGEHLVQFYSEDDVLLQSLQRIVGGTLGSGDSALVIATEAHRRALAKRLKWCGIDLQVAQACGRYREVDAATVLSRLETCTKPLNAHELLHHTVFHADGPPAVDRASTLVFGEVVGLMWERNQFQDAARLESLWNAFQASQQFTLLCAYQVRRFNTLKDMEPFVEISCAHSGVISEDAHMEVVSQWHPGKDLREDSRSCPKWILLYEGALGEPDRHRLFKKIETAEAAILERIEKPDSPTEQRTLLDALARLLILKRQKLGFG